MDGLRMLSGSELVDKGVTRKIDGQLPGLGDKEVSPTGSWLEQKQIQSALEARKHLIELDRIEKNGTLSHAIWRDDLKLAEVTKKAGGHWQYIGHNVGKHLYLLPEEVLFLIEINCLLLKHDEVTVSLQKAYSLCLDEKITIEHYKIYASLSRLGYRVFRHTVPTSNNKSDLQNASKGNKKLSDSLEELLHTSQNVSVKEHPFDDSIIDETGETSNDNVIKKETYDNINYEDDVKMEVSENISNETANDEAPSNHSDECDNLAPLIDPENIKVEIIENHAGSEIVENDINNSIEKALQSSGVDLNQDSRIGDEIPPINVPFHSENVISNHANVNNVISTENVDNNEECHGIVESDENNFTVNENITTVNQMPNLPTEDIVINGNGNITENVAPEVTQDNTNELTQVSTENNEIAIINEEVHVEISDNRTQAIVYSVDESGVIRAVKEDSSMETDAAESNVAEIATNSKTTKRTGPSLLSKKSIEHYDVEMAHYDAKLKKLIKRKIDTAYTGQRSRRKSLDAIENYCQKHVALVDSPDEKYLPRNIFLHKTLYLINLNVVSNLNASNANILCDALDLSEPPNRSSRGTDAPIFTDLPRFLPRASINNAPLKYPTYRPFYRPTNWYSRLNYDTYYNYNMLRSRPPGLFLQPRYRYQLQPPVPSPDRYDIDLSSASGSDHSLEKQCETLKSFHLKTIRHIALRFKSGIGKASQVQALNSLLATYNSRYGEHFELSQDFDIINRKREVPVIVLDDEPKRKKARLDNKEVYNANLNKLKVLAEKLKDLHMKKLAVSRHRRVFSNAIKAFNKSFDADVYLDCNFEIKDRKLIVLDSSSDSDSVVTVREKMKSRKRKKLRNPYNILLKQGLDDVNVGASTSASPEDSILQAISLNPNKNVGNETTNIENTNTSTVSDNSGEGLLKYFHKDWLPKDDDFGRAELCSRETARFDTLYFAALRQFDYSKQTVPLNSWIDIKLRFLNEMQVHLYVEKRRSDTLGDDYVMETETPIKPIMQSNCTNVRSALKQLALIQRKKEIQTDTNIRIHFDVCNRDVHFKKSSPPKPNFRVVCCEESAAFPSISDVVGLRSKYDDAIPIVFAFTGISSSISYLQINPIDTPLYIPDDMT